jgi:O-antigen/teichoic acid export membrane protein
MPLTRDEITFAVRNHTVKQTALVAYRATSDLIGKGAFLVVTVAAARRLPQEAFGIFSLASTLGWILAIATDFGVQLHLARVIAQTPSDAGRLLRAWIRLRLTTSAIAVAATTAIVFALPAARAYAPAIVLLTTMYVVAGLIEFLHYFYRGLSRSDVESSLTLGQRMGTLALALVVLWLKPDLTVLAAAMLAPVVATFAYSLRFALRISGPNSAPVPPVMREWRRDVMPIAAGVVLSALYFRVDVLLVELWSGTQAVALYNAVFRLVEAMRLFPAAVLAVALPILFRAMNTKPLVQVSLIVTVFALAGTAVAEAIAPWVVPFLYGSAYAAGVPAFRVLLLAFPLMSLNYALTHQLIGWNGHRAYAVICGVAFLFNIGLNAFLIPSFSIVGAAWSTLWTEVVLSAGCIAALMLRFARPAGERAVAMEAS